MEEYLYCINQEVEGIDDRSLLMESHVSPKLHPFSPHSTRSKNRRSLAGIVSGSTSGSSSV